MDSRLKKARKASGMTLEAASSILGVSIPTYIAYERDPSTMKFEQYFALLNEMDEDAKGIMAGVLEEVRDNSEGSSIYKLTLGSYCTVVNGSAEIEEELAQTV